MSQLAEFYLAHGFWLWLAVAGAVLAVEIAFGSGWLLWPAASAAAVAVVSLFTDSATVEIGLFAVLTIVTTLGARRFWPRRTEAAPDINDNVARLVGHHGRVTAAFVNGAGRVLVDGVVRSGQGTGPTTNYTGSAGELSGTFVDVRVNSVSGDITVLRRPEPEEEW